MSPEKPQTKIVFFPSGTMLYFLHKNEVTCEKVQRVCITNTVEGGTDTTYYFDVLIKEDFRQHQEVAAVLSPRCFPTKKDLLESL